MGDGEAHGSHPCVCLLFSSFQPLSCRGGTRFTLPFVCWAQPCQGRAGMVVQLPRTPSPPPLLVVPRTGMGRAARAAGWAVASKHPSAGASLAREHGLTLTAENPCLAEARDSWGSIFYPVILAFWTDGKSTELGAHPPDCTCELSGQSSSPHTHTLRK